MKKLVVLLIVLALSSGMLFAATSGSVTLSGGVGQTAALTVTPLNNYNTLALGKNDAETGLIIAQINELANGNSGYTVELESANAFQLYNTTAATGVSYTFTYDVNGTPVTYTAAELDASNKVLVTDTTSGTGGLGVDKDASITYDVNGVTLPAGTYSDTLTFIISNKA